MSVAKDRWEKREAFAALMEKGEFQGYITNDDIIIVFPEAEDSGGAPRAVADLLPFSGRRRL